MLASAGTSAAATKNGTVSATHSATASSSEAAVATFTGAANAVRFGPWVGAAALAGLVAI